MPANLTETAINKALRRTAETGKRVDLSDGGSLGSMRGLRIRLTPAGAASWVLACRDRQGQMRRFPVGSWPEMGLAAARDSARALHAKVKGDGADPIAERREVRAKAARERAGDGTLAAVLDLYGQKEGAALKSWPESRKRINLVLAPVLGKLAETLTVRALQKAVDAYHSPKSAAFAVRSVRPALKWAAHPGRGLVPAELAQITPPAEGAVERRRRVLSRDELAAILPALRASDRPHAKAMLFMLLTAARREEASTARWGHVDFEARTWTIPETKNGEPHVVPLSRQAVDLLQSCRPDNPAPSAAVFAVSTGSPVANWDRAAKAIQHASKTTGWTRHDLRRTAATMMGEMGELPDIIEAALNHATIHSALASTYNRSRYRPQVAAALQRLADALDGIEAGAAAVVAIRGAA